MLDVFRETFNWLPLAFVLNHKVLVLHGGLFSKDGVTLDDLRSVDRNRCVMISASTTLRCAHFHSVIMHQLTCTIMVKTFGRIVAVTCLHVYCGVFSLLCFCSVARSLVGSPGPKSHPCTDIHTDHCQFDIFATASSMVFQSRQTLCLLLRRSTTALLFLLVPLSFFQCPLLTPSFFIPPC